MHVNKSSVSMHNLYFLFLTFFFFFLIRSLQRKSDNTFSEHVSNGSIYCQNFENEFTVTETKLLI